MDLQLERITRQSEARLNRSVIRTITIKLSSIRKHKNNMKGIEAYGSVGMDG